jgi:aspartyl-tRNA(Asn)/glutamyl-tRNA(Gln) amidotransferase subunit C|tara:strand:+ start:80 stop:367 length:288 start_codon:yes stop_codon:yes gene_type:complete
MSVDKDTVRQIAKLARIRVEDTEAQALVGEMNNLLTWIEQLGELDTTSVPPMTSVVEVRVPLRQDQVTDGGYADQVIANAPDAVHDFYVVPKVVE